MTQIFGQSRKAGLKEGESIGRKAGLEEGLKEGGREKALAIARQMQVRGIPLETILECTGLSAEELEAVWADSGC